VGVARCCQCPQMQVGGVSEKRGSPNSKRKDLLHGSILTLQSFSEVTRSPNQLWRVSCVS
jgi:hypothetical protein